MQITGVRYAWAENPCCGGNLGGLPCPVNSCPSMSLHTHTPPPPSLSLSLCVGVCARACLCVCLSVFLSLYVSLQPLHDETAGWVLQSRHTTRRFRRFPSLQKSSMRTIPLGPLVSVNALPRKRASDLYFGPCVMIADRLSAYGSSDQVCNNREVHS